MTRALSFTKASVKRAVSAAREAGLCVTGIGPDGTVIVDNGPNGASLVSGTAQNDPYAIAAGRSDAKATRKRNARAS
jgi:hypothetical protein